MSDEHQPERYQAAGEALVAAQGRLRVALDKLEGAHTFAADERERDILRSFEARLLTVDAEVSRIARLLRLAQQTQTPHPIPTK